MKVETANVIRFIACLLAGAAIVALIYVAINVTEGTVKGKRVFFLPAFTDVVNEKEVVFEPRSIGDINSNGGNEPLEVEELIDFGETKLLHRVELCVEESEDNQYLANFTNVGDEILTLYLLILQRVVTDDEEVILILHDPKQDSVLQELNPGETLTKTVFQNSEIQFIEFISTNKTTAVVNKLIKIREDHVEIKRFKE
ncbi:MAG: hypothetical protein ABIE68_05045 [bacterium]